MSSNHMGVAITPATVADGTLLAALDPKLHPQRAIDDGTVATGTDPVGADGPPTVALATATTGGSLVAASYYYRVAAVFPTGAGELSAEQSIVVPSGTSTNTVTLTLTAPVGETGGFKVYGRTTGAELHLGDVAHGGTSFVDTGSVTPAGALPVESKDTNAGEKTGHLAPRPIDSGDTGEAAHGEGDSLTPSEGGEGVEG